jgi:hypothetical protein
VRVGCMVVRMEEQLAHFARQHGWRARLQQESITARGLRLLSDGLSHVPGERSPPSSPSGNGADQQTSAERRSSNPT